MSKSTMLRGWKYYGYEEHLRFIIRDLFTWALISDNHVTVQMYSNSPCYTRSLYVNTYKEIDRLVGKYSTEVLVER